MRVDRRGALFGALLGGTAGLAMAARVGPFLQQPANFSLDRFVPATFAGWRSSPGTAEIVLPSADESFLNPVYSAQLARVYSRQPSDDNPDNSSVLMVIAYSAIQGGGLLVHRPEACYPGAGYTISADRPETWALSPSRTIAGRFLTAENEDRIEQILYWIRVGSEFPQTAMTEKLAGAWTALAGGRPDGVLVRLSTVTADAVGAQHVLQRFAADLYAAADNGSRALLAGG